MIPILLLFLSIVSPQLVASDAIAFVAADKAIIPIDLSNNEVGTLIPMEREGYPVDIAISPDGKTAYVTQYFNATIVAVDLPTGRIGTPLSLASPPEQITISPNGKDAYVVCVDDVVIPISLESWTAGSPIRVGALPKQIVITPDGKKGFVASKPVTVIDLETNRVIATIEIGRDIEAIGMTSDGKMVYAVSMDVPGVFPIDVEFHGVKKPILLETRGRASRIVIASDNKMAYVSVATIDGKRNYVTPITFSPNKPGTPIQVQSAPLSMAFSPDNKRLYVTNFGSSSVSVIDVAINQVIETIPLNNRGPCAIAVTSSP